jgi:hypothetical protein
MLKTSGELFKFGVDTKNNAQTNIMSLLEGTTLLIQEISLLGRDQNNSFAGIVEVVKKQ